MSTPDPIKAILIDALSDPRIGSRDVTALSIEDRTFAEGTPQPRIIAAQQPAPRILLIGEDPLMLRTVDRLLQRAGYHIRTGDRFGTAGCLEDDRPALVIVDVPDDWTWASSRFPLPKGPFIPPVLWISNRILTGIGAPHALIKPFTASDLLDAVEALLHPGASVQ